MVKIYEDTWKSIIANKGSVQHLEFLMIGKKDVLKQQLKLIKRGYRTRGRQTTIYLSVAKSLNLFFPT